MRRRQAAASWSALNQNSLTSTVLGLPAVPEFLLVKLRFFVAVADEAAATTAD